MNTQQAAFAAAGLAAFRAAIVELGRAAIALERALDLPAAAPSPAAAPAEQAAPAQPAAPAEQPATPSEADLRRDLSAAIVAAIAAGHKAAAQQAMKDLGFAGSLSTIPAQDLPKHLAAVRALVATNG